MNKLIVEFIGTFFLVLAIGLNVLAPGSGAFAPLAIGMTLMAVIYAGGHTSGAHYNPAVTIGGLVRGSFKAPEVPGYIIVQLLAAAAGSYCAMYLKPSASPSPMVLSAPAVLLAEFVFTFLLVWVILNVATAKATSGNSYFGLAIAAAVIGGAYGVGAISGAAFNPAVAVALGLMKILSWADIWMYLVAEFAGGIVAAIVFKMTHPNE